VWIISNTDKARPTRIMNYLRREQRRPCLREPQAY
jgi:hypothetical protein